MLFEIAYAASSGIDPQATYDISDVIRVSVALLVLFSGGLSVIFIIWGGVMLILSGGKDEKVKPAVNSIRYAIVGIIVIIISLFLLPKAGDALNLNVSQYISPNAVFSTVRQISAKLFGNNSNAINVTPASSNGTNTTTLPDDFSNL